ncbi:flagellar filament capping protein FliD [Anaeromicrobium sediminis]|nr:flagellar filament capping protein FliD [Anaeromicrobium sediminis]
MRITGIASGMDTETMVNDLMKAERVRLDKIEQEKQLSLWRQEQYNDINKSISQFILDTRKDLFGTSSYSKSPSSLTWVNKATSSDESIFTASSTASAPTGTHTMKVTQIAKGVSVASASAVSATNDSKLSDLGIADGSISFDIDGTNTATIQYKATDTVKDLIDKINSAMGDELVPDLNTPKVPLGIQASFDDANGRLFLSTKGTGLKAQIKVTDDAGKLFTGGTDKFKLGLTEDVAVNGQNAKIDFDGAIGLEYESNNISINGINITLNSTSATDQTIKIDTDVDGIYDKIKGFVDKYNELIGNLNKEISEKRYRDFNPLTKEEKEAMNDDDIKLWEDKAKSGLLRNDQYINKLIQNVRSGLYESVITDDKGTSDTSDDIELSPYSQLFEIGITTGEWKDKGKLVIDETKFKDAIKADASGVMDLLFTPSDEDNSSKSGLVNRMYDHMIDGMKEIINKSGTGDNSELYRSVKSNILIDFVTGGNGRKGAISLIDEEVLAFDTRITREQDRLSSVEARYWSQFSAMEKALSEMQSQSSWLTQQMG